MASLTTLALDTFTDADGTDLTSHTADSGFGQWGGFAGISKIFSNQYAGVVALSNYNHSGSSVSIADVTYVAEITRQDSTAADNLGGLRWMIRSNGANKGGGHSSLYVSFMGGGTAQTAVVKVGRQAGASQTEVSTLTTMSWATDQTYRAGCFVTGSGNSSAFSVWVEDTDGGNHVDFPMYSWVTADYDSNYSFSIDCDLSASARTWRMDNLAIYDSYYTGLASLAGGNGGGGGGAGTITDAISAQAPAVSMLTVGPILTYG